MIRIIPPNTNVKTTIYKDKTIVDVLIFLLFTTFGFIFFAFKIHLAVKFFSLLTLAGLGFLTVSDIGFGKNYLFILKVLVFLLRSKKVKATFFSLLDYKFEKNYIKTKNSFIGAIKVEGIDFALLNEYGQDQLIYKLENLFKKIQNGKIIKIDEPIDFSIYKKQMKQRYKKLWQEKKHEFYQIAREQYKTLRNACEAKVHKRPAYYLFISSVELESLFEQINYSLDCLTNIGLLAQPLEQDQIKIFFSLFFGREFKNKEDIEIPSIVENKSSLKINNEEYCIMSIQKLPLKVSNAWLYRLFSLEDAVVVLNFSIFAERQKVFKKINKAVSEYKSRLNEKNITETNKREIEYKIEALELLIDDITADSQQLHEFQVLVMTHADNKTKVLQTFNDSHITPTKLTYQQIQAYSDVLPIFSNSKLKETLFHSGTNALASTFPFVMSLLMDKYGLYLGYEEHPVFFDNFYNLRKEREIQSKRTNANICVLGTSGSGKSYMTKHHLLNLLLDDNQVFILDPENEYYNLCQNLKGDFIDVSGSSSGIINPLQVFPSLDVGIDERTEKSEYLEIKQKPLSAHRLFLEEFFRLVMPGLTTTQATLLKVAIGRLYEKFCITDNTDFSILKPKDYPLLEDLANLILEMLQEAKATNNEFEIDILNVLNLLMNDFKKTGTNASLWNGYTTLKINNKFTVFNFQTLFAVANKKIANAQMLLVMKFLTQEIIKNRNKNLLNGDLENKRKITIAIDEAHQFIDKEFPIALQFIYQMTKRIRKYSGSILVATQNIKDFLGGSEEIKRSASAVINGCQYMFLFGLAEDDLNSVKELYSCSSSSLTDAEINFLSTASLGQCLLKIDSTKRLMLQIHTYPGEAKYFD